MWLRNLFKKDKSGKSNLKHRRFIGASNSKMSNFNTTFARINGELKSDYIALTLRARDLSKNNATVNSWINLMLRSVLGNTGFILNCTSYNQDGSADTTANKIIQDYWHEYTKSYKKYVSADGQQNGLDFDRMVLFNYLVDGEVFIRKVKDNKSKFGIRFEIIDSLDVDTLYNGVYQNSGEKIVMGIKVDQHYKPLSYFVRKDRSADYYLAGDRIEIPASQIIHIYKKQYANQVRGFTPLAPVLLTLNSIQEYQKAQINASILSSVFMGVYQKTGSGDAFENFDESEIDQNGDVALELENGVFKYAPEGWSLKQIANNHPNSNVGNFQKALLKTVSGALGMSYNKISSDFQATSYSSLRQSNMEDAVTVKQIQQFMVDNWKDLEFAEWLKYLLISDLTNLPYSKIEKFMQHTFQGRNFEYLDPAKEMQAIKLRMSLGLSSPIQEIQLAGKDPVDILNSWQKWNQMLKDRNLQLADSLQSIQEIEQIDYPQKNKNQDQQEL